MPWSQKLGHLLNRTSTADGCGGVSTAGQDDPGESTVDRPPGLKSRVPFHFDGVHQQSHLAADLDHAGPLVEKPRERGMVAPPTA